VRHNSERQILRDIREGRREACEFVVCQYYKSIYNFMVYLTGNANLAEDLTQETFISVWTSIGHYKGRASLKTWLHQIAYHKFIDAHRKVKRYSALVSDFREQKQDAPDTLNPLYHLINNEDFYLLYEAMRKLELSEYLLVVLHYIQGFSFRQMTVVLDEPAGTIKWRINKALKKLRILLMEGT